MARARRRRGPRCGCGRGRQRSGRESPTFRAGPRPQRRAPRRCPAAARVPCIAQTRDVHDGVRPCNARHPSRLGLHFADACRQRRLSKAWLDDAPWANLRLLPTKNGSRVNSLSQRSSNRIPCRGSEYLSRCLSQPDCASHVNVPVLWPHAPRADEQKTAARERRVEEARSQDGWPMK
jgi:hypothetical protein